MRGWRGWGFFVLIGLLGCAAAGAVANFPGPALDDGLAAAKSSQTAVFSGGCFWGIQLVFEHVKGVSRATAGYSGGAASTAQYELVSSGTTGHAESVEVVFDPSQVTFGQLLQVFFQVAHDPTELNRQGPDTGSQYRSVIFYTSERQRQIAQAYIAQLDAAHVFRNRIVTAVTPLKAFYRAEDYHQEYATLNPTNPYIAINDLPKLENLRVECPNLYVKH